MWRSYFYNIQRKYSMRVSKTQPLVIRLDGKSVTRNKNIDLIDRDNANSFSNALEKTVKYFSAKYECYAIFGSDEVSFIFPNPYIVVKDLDSDEVYYSNEIISLFTQYFFDYFNEFDNHKKVFWHGKCFSISDEKIKSYIKYRSKIIQNVMTTYFLIKKGAYRGIDNLDNKIKKCKSFKDYKELLQDVDRGIMYFNGRRIALDKYLEEDKIEEINTIDVDNAFSDLL